EDRVLVRDRADLEPLAVARADLAEADGRELVGHDPDLAVGVDLDVAAHRRILSCGKSMTTWSRTAQRVASTRFPSRRSMRSVRSPVMYFGGSDCRVPTSMEFDRTVYTSFSSACSARTLVMKWRNLTGGFSPHAISYTSSSNRRNH